MKPFARMIHVPSLALAYPPSEEECLRQLNAGCREWEIGHKEHKGHKEMKRINPYWLKSLAIHALTLMVATFIGLVAIGNKEAPGMIFYSLGAALISPLAYPIVGPYMVAFLLAAYVPVFAFLFWGVVILSYVAYFVLLLASILEKDGSVRVVGCILLAGWLVLVFIGFSNWALFWSV